MTRWRNCLEVAVSLHRVAERALLKRETESGGSEHVRQIFRGAFDESFESGSPCSILGQQKLSDAGSGAGRAAACRTIYRETPGKRKARAHRAAVAYLPDKPHNPLTRARRQAVSSEMVEAGERRGFAIDIGICDHNYFEKRIEHFVSKINTHNPYNHVCLIMWRCSVEAA